MRQELNDNELELVAGGEVCFSQKRNRVSFSTLQVGFPIKDGCYDQARSIAIQLFAANPDMSEKDFDILVKNTLQSKGLI